MAKNTEKKKQDEVRRLNTTDASGRHLNSDAENDHHGAEKSEDEEAKPVKDVDYGNPVGNFAQETAKVRGKEMSYGQLMNLVKEKKKQRALDLQAKLVEGYHNRPAESPDAPHIPHVDGLEATETVVDEDINDQE